MPTSPQPGDRVTFRVGGPSRVGKPTMSIKVRS